MHKDNNLILFGRKNSPLVLGIGKDEYFIASDVPAFLEHTNKVIYIENNEYGIINDKLQIFTIETNIPIKRKETQIDWTVEQAQKE